MSSNVQKILSGVTLSLAPKTQDVDLKDSIDHEMHDVHFQQGISTSATAGSLETLVSSHPMIVEASPFEDSSVLIAYGTENSLNIIRHTGSLGPSQRSIDTIESLQFAHVANFAMGGRLSSLAWSPQSSSGAHDVCVALAAACSDFKVQYYFANENMNQQETFIGHQSYINSICFNNHTPRQNDAIHFASTGDDHTVQLWNLNVPSEPLQILTLNSPGMSVKFHPSDPSSMMVASKDGSIQIYDLRGNALVSSSLFTDSGPLLDADWNPSDRNFIGAVSNHRWVVFDCLKPQSPINGPQASSPLTKFRWAHSHPNLFATTHSSIVNVWDFTNATAPHAHSESNSMFGGISWLHDRPCLLAATHRNINFTLV